MADMRNRRTGPQDTGAVKAPMMEVAAGTLTLAIALLASLWISATCVHASAWADELPEDVPRTISGTCHIGGTWMIGEDSFFAIPSFTGLLEGGVPSSTFICIDHTAAAPENVDAVYEGTVSNYSLGEGWVEYYVVITPPGVTDGVTRNEFGLVGYQRVAGTVRIPWSFNGGIRLVKRSANESVTDGNGCYSLKGAVYGVFDKKNAARSRDEGKALATFTTNAKGEWKSGDDFTAGTYYVAETKAPKGYVLDESVYTVEVEAGSSVLVNAGVGYVSDEPQNNPVTLWAAKHDAETADHGAQGSATLAGTRFEIAYYDGYYELANLPSKPARTWVVTCGADGKAYARDDLKVSGDDFYRTPAGDVTIPLGTVVVREKTAPERYRNGSGGEAKLLQIKSGGGGATLGVYTAPTFKNEVMRGGVIVGKVDRQSRSYAPQGATTLAGATFSIVTDNAQQVVVDGTRYTTGDVVKTIETELVGGKYVAQTPADCLPAGYYTVRETASPPGYLYDSESQAWKRSFEISADGQVVDLTDPGDAAGNQVIRGDFGFSKVDGLTDARIGNVPFMVTSETTGESHVLMVDANGMTSTSSGWNRHSVRTNANDKAVTADGERYTVDESLLDEGAGIWFCGGRGETCDPDDDLGALPFDTYTVRELPVTANAGYELVTFSVCIARHARELDLGTVDDNPGPSIATSLTDANGAHLVAATETARLVDTVHYTNLDVRQPYTLRGTLHLVGEESAVEPAPDDAQEDAADATAEAGKPFEVQELTFTPKSANGNVDVAFTVDTSKLGGKKIVAFEELFDAQGALVAEHVDIADADQTVYVPEIGTSLAEQASQSHEAPSYGPIELVDTVSYRGLAPGMTYTMAGALHVRAEDGADAGPALDEEGRPIEAVQSFTPEEPDGTVEVTFSFSAPSLAGCTTVAFEELTYRDVAYAVHADIADEGQSVNMPRIGTTLVDAADGDHGAAADEAITLIDVVTYQGVTPGLPYTVTGTLHVRNADGSDAGEALDENGDAITATETFMPESDTGEASVTFAFSAPALAGKTVVAFEELSRDGRTYAVHADIADDDQTVWFNPPHTEEGKPPAETPPAEEPPKETPPKEAPPEEAPPAETTVPEKGTLPRTGDVVDAMPFVFVAAAAAGLVAATLCVRRMQRDREITINRGPDRTQAQGDASARYALRARDRRRTGSSRLP